ncbi:phosphoadenylyl-sulfate reductase [Parasphingopyxis algicola]|uniref:phosphoadenylyl-sulfate reductase n=1 Tax=Parasphingopyxis algicola TaxID=2026624 RepID=UPI0015A2E2CE|nr:phosphoadenylyl-sulfate reductase [Parasphingopyxis algicola]QLC25971.1 phosphoadenylyl-sulfate reductase [Parasphingopyxis algicola]
MALATRTAIELDKKAAALNASFEKLTTPQIIAQILNGRVAGRTAVLSSFGAEAAVLLKLVADKDPTTPVVFLETRKHFTETLEYVDALMDALGLTTLVRVRPSAAQLAAADPWGDLHATDSDRCCYVRKTLPMIGALKNYDCVLTGRKRFQTDDRKQMDHVEVQQSWLRINPLAGWTPDDINAFLNDHGLARHPLVACGYASIGCAPCTIPSEDDRAGRWAGQEKTECGIHEYEGGAGSSGSTRQKGSAD